MSQTCIVLGRTLEERVDALESASKSVQVANWLAIGVLLWSVAFPRPYGPVLWALIGLLVSAVAGSLALGRSIRFGTTPGEPNPAIGGVILLSAVGLAIRAFFDWEIILVARFWGVTLLVAFVVFGILSAVFHDVRNKPQRALAVALVCLVFGYGSVVTLNGHYDRSKPELHRAQVLHKTRSRGKARFLRYDRYHLKISRWEMVALQGMVRVDKTMFESTDVGDRLVVEHRQGAFGIPWYTVRKPSADEVVARDP